jgi:hypothetical protein
MARSVHITAHSNTAVAHRSRETLLEGSEA